MELNAQSPLKDSGQEALSASTLSTRLTCGVPSCAFTVIVDIQATISKMSNLNLHIVLIIVDIELSGTNPKGWET
jgi:hypothetical protein